VFVESNSNLVPAVEIDECAERALERSSTSPSLLDAQNSHRRHSAPNLPDDATPFRECSVRTFIFIPSVVLIGYVYRWKGTNLCHLQVVPYQDVFFITLSLLHHLLGCQVLLLLAVMMTLVLSVQRK
jgi:hypothetical protein